MQQAIEKWRLEFMYDQEMRFDSLYQFLDCLKRWWELRPRIILCALCERRMWGYGEHGPTYCSPECAHYDGVPTDEEELPF